MAHQKTSWLDLIEEEQRPDHNAVVTPSPPGARGIEAPSGAAAIGQSHRVEEEEVTKALQKLDLNTVGQVVGVMMGALAELAGVLRVARPPNVETPKNEARRRTRKDRSSHSSKPDLGPHTVFAGSGSDRTLKDRHRARQSKATVRTLSARSNQTQVDPSTGSMLKTSKNKGARKIKGKAQGSSSKGQKKGSKKEGGESRLESHSEIVRCYKCNSTEHRFRNCQIQGDLTKTECTRCKLGGRHQPDFCPFALVAPSKGQEKRSKRKGEKPRIESPSENLRCYKCNYTGHKHRDCLIQGNLSRTVCALCRLGGRHQSDFCPFGLAERYQKAVSDPAAATNQRKKRH